MSQTKQRHYLIVVLLDYLKRMLNRMAGGADAVRTLEANVEEGVIAGEKFLNELKRVLCCTEGCG